MNAVKAILVSWWNNSDEMWTYREVSKKKENLFLSLNMYFETRVQRICLVNNWPQWDNTIYLSEWLKLKKKEREKLMDNTIKHG